MKSNKTLEIKGIEQIDYNTKKNIDLSVNYYNAISDLNKKFLVDYEFTKEDLELFPNKKKGDIIKRLPPMPNEPKEAFELFKNYYAAIQFELQKHLFEERGNVWNKACIKVEIEAIELWINETKKINYKDCLRNHLNNIQYYNSEPHEFLRLTNGFYEGSVMSNYHETAATVYGRYFLFYEYLKVILKEFETPIETETKLKAPTPKEEVRTLKELFKYPAMYEDYLKLLRDEDKPIINNENCFIGKNKSVIIVWYVLLEIRGIIEKVKNDVQRAIILNKTFSNYNVSESLFRAKNVRANEEYYNHFSTELTAINGKKH